MDDSEMDRSLSDFMEKRIARAARRIGRSEEPEAEKSRLTGWKVLNNAIVGGSMVGCVWAVVWLVK